MPSPRIHESRSAPPAQARCRRCARAAHRGRGRATSARPSGSASAARPSSVPPEVGACGRAVHSGSDSWRSGTARHGARPAPRNRRGPARRRAASPAPCPQRPAAIRGSDSSAGAAPADRARPVPETRTRRRRVRGRSACWLTSPPSSHVRRLRAFPVRTPLARVNGPIRSRRRRCLIGRNPNWRTFRWKSHSQESQS